MQNLSVGSMFTGVGGLDLGLEALGAHVVWQAEVDKYASRVLAARYPETPNLGDVTKIEWSTVERPDVICGGYPCQPFSFAGQRKGEDDPRHLWPALRSAVHALRPRFVVLENVRGHLSLGFGRVLGDLSALGYDASWAVVRASDVGAPHRRERLFIVAADASGERLGEHPGGTPAEEARARGGDLAADHRGPRSAFDWRATPYDAAITRWEHVLGRGCPDPTDDDGRLAPWFVEWMMGLPAGWVTDVDVSRTQQLKMLGNGVVPQQAAHAVEGLCRI